MTEFTREGARIIRDVDFNRVRNTERIQQDNKVAYSEWRSELDRRRKMHREAHAIREANRIFVPLTPIRHTWRDYLAAPFKVVRELWRMWR